MLRRTGLARGFTLIEIAIVMVVIGLILSGGLMAVAPVLQSSKVSDTKARMDRVEQALTLYAIRYGCLPCPAAANEPSAAVNTPGNSIAGTTYTSGCGTTCAFPTAAIEGMVPWVSLGLNEGDVVDGWGMRISYSVSAGLELSNAMVRTPPATYPAGAITVNNIAAVEQTAGAGNRAAYVLWSHGPNQCRGYYSGGRRNQPAPLVCGGTSEQANYIATTTYIQNDEIGGQDTNAAAHFDDIIRFRPAPMIIQLCGANACGNPA